MLFRYRQNYKLDNDLLRPRRKRQKNRNYEQMRKRPVIHHTITRHPLLTGYQESSGCFIPRWSWMKVKAIQIVPNLPLTVNIQSSETKRFKNERAQANILRFCSPQNHGDVVSLGQVTLHFTNELKLTRCINSIPNTIWLDREFRERTITKDLAV